MHYSCNPSCILRAVHSKGTQLADQDSEADTVAALIHSQVTYLSEHAASAMQYAASGHLLVHCLHMQS